MRNKDNQTKLLILIGEKMQVNQNQIKQMKLEDMHYGEKSGHKPKTNHQKSKNQVNFARMNMKDVMAMGED